ncbi:threonine-phosphate decarboxylase CobD [Tateyamaria pelophila]|uniref:threonine-phosphate decarboxylase CobD n=1 Tax=Tateyamaria pelophila TaxID=328415 RepID=UPI001CBE9C15|nr:threonine-phosphate decarboxylase CobD [Tateyamaria pelophila]
MTKARDHGGGIDAAAAQYGGDRSDWIDLSTGINPVPYPIPDLPMSSWTALPDQAAAQALTQAARHFWGVPEGADILAAPGASALIAQIPRLAKPARVMIPAPTYNEHAASFAAQGWQVTGHAPAEAQVLVHPNNPDGRLWSASALSGGLNIIDESFGDIAPDRSLIAQADRPGVLILKSFGKFWGLAGVRLGFVIGDPKLIARLRDMLGPWPVSGIALTVGARALQDTQWAAQTRQRLTNDAHQLDALLSGHGATVVGGTTLFRLYDVDDAQLWQHRLAQHHIWSRTFPYASNWLRLGLPGPQDWTRLEAAL